MSWRGLMPAIGCLLLAGCATSAKSVAPMSYEGPLYDPATEWAQTAEEPDLTARSPSRARPRFVRTAYAPDPDLPLGLRPFSGDELDRIARVQSIVEAAARTSEVPPDLVNGIIWVESRFQVQALSSVGCRGLMQLMPSTGREVARAIGRDYQPFDPEFNIHAGAYYFARLVQRFSGNLRLALAAYNIGPATVEGWLRDHAPVPERSRAYVDNVFTAARTFRAFPP
jgi:soluble lytic murein transglycosylase-like protein